MAVQTPYSNLTALVVDDQAVQQTTLRGQLTMLGLGRVDAAAGAEDAVRLVRSKPYQLVLCDYNLNDRTDGQQLLEHLRDHQLLRPDCVFFMVTAENGYASVASATENKPDAYLLKPITAADIEDRLKAQLERRRVLLPVNERLAVQDLAGALAECERLLARKDRWFVQAMQLKAQTLMQLGRHEDARGVYESALAQRPQLVWAQLGLARAFKAAGDPEQARRVALDVLASKDGEKTVAAYDIAADALEAMGDKQGAQALLHDAAAVVPSAKRLRLAGDSAYRNGDLAAARECLQKVTKATRGAVTSQAQDSLTLAQVLIDAGDAAAALGLLDDAAPMRRHDDAFEAVSLALRAQAQLKAGDAGGAAGSLARARAAAGQAKGDFGTVALAKAEILSGDTEAGLERLKGAISADHENARLVSMVRRALDDTGCGSKAGSVIDAASAGMTARVADARRLFRDSRTGEALALIEAALQQFPENTGVLLQAAQLNCMALRLNKRRDDEVTERVRLYLAQLDRLMPAHERVTQMRRYYRDTLAALQGEKVPA